MKVGVSTISSEAVQGVREILDSRFYLSLEDDLMRIFASDRMRGMMQGLGEPGVPIEARIVTTSIERAQRKVEARNFDIRKQLLEYDDVANDQRQMIYRQRDEIMSAEEVSETLDVLWQDVIEASVHQFVPPMSLAEQWDIPGLTQSLSSDLDLISLQAFGRRRIARGKWPHRASIRRSKKGLRGEGRGGRPGN